MDETQAVITKMELVITELFLLMSKRRWECFVVHLQSLSQYFDTTEIKFKEWYFDLRRISPVPRPHVVRIFFKETEHKVCIYRAMILSLDGSAIFESPSDLREQVKFLVQEFTLEK